MPARRPDPLAHATQLLERFGLFDGHNDLPFVIRMDETSKGDVVAYGLDRVHQETDTDIPRMKQGRVSAQVFAAFVPTRVPDPGRFTLEQIALALDIETTHPETFLPARRPSDVIRAKRMGKIASIISVESGVGLRNSVAPLRVWHAAGVRILTLCHNESLDWIDSATDLQWHGGITDLGRAIVAECNRLGVIIDLAHVAPKAQHDVLDVAAAPLLWSHSNAYALCDHPRNVPDDVLARVKANGGVVMATFVPEFITQKSYDWVKPFKEHGKTPEGLDIVAAMQEKARKVGSWPRGSIRELADHIDYIVSKTGIDHIGIGSDFYGGPNPDDLNDVSRFPHLIAELVARGWSDAAIAKIAIKNAMRVWRAVEAHAKASTVPPSVMRLDADAPRRRRGKS